MHLQILFKRKEVFAAIIFEEVTDFLLCKIQLSLDLFNVANVYTRVYFSYLR